MGILQPNPPIRHGAAARRALAPALPWVPSVCCSAASLPGIWCRGWFELSYYKVPGQRGPWHNLMIIWSITITLFVQNREWTWFWLKTPPQRYLWHRNLCSEPRLWHLCCLPRTETHLQYLKEEGITAAFFFSSASRKERNVIALCSSWACWAGCLIVLSLKDM